jgi:hypothetical protein
LNSVALGVPGDPAVCWAKAGVEQNAAVSATRMVVFNAFRFMSPSPFLSMIESYCLRFFLLQYLPRGQLPNDSSIRRAAHNTPLASPPAIMTFMCYPPLNDVRFLFMAFVSSSSSIYGN